MKITLGLFICFLAFCNVSIGQQIYDWHAYGIRFDLADDFREITNTAEEFSADGDGMSLSIFPFEDETIDETDITAYTMSIAASLQLQHIEDVSIISFNGFKGGYAEGVHDGARIFLMGLIDPESATNFFVVINFLDGDELATEEAVSICRGITKM